MNKSPTENHSLCSCLRYAAPGAGILLIENAVYAALNQLSNNPITNQAMQQFNIYVLQEDLAARGLQHLPLNTEIEQVTYKTFVDLVIKYHCTITWS